MILFAGCRSKRAFTELTNADEQVDLQQVNIQSPWGTYKGSSTKDYEIQHVTLDLAIDFDERKVSGKAELILSPLFFDQEVLQLDAYKLAIKHLKLNNEIWHLFEYDSSQIYIELPQVLSAGEQLVCEIEYEINQFSIPAQASADNQGGIFLVDYWEGRAAQLWTQGETAFTCHWYPTIDQPNQRYTQQISLTVADSLKTLSNGVLRSQQKKGDGLRKDTWVLDKPHAPYLSMIAVGSFEEQLLSIEGIQASVFATGVEVETVSKVFSRTSRMIDFYEELFEVEFPWPAYHQIVVKDYISGAMENTSAVVFLEDIALTEQEQEYQHFDDYISHELAHHWFGNLVTCESWANLALNESFASYSEQLWNEYYYGQDSADLLAHRELQTYLRESIHKKESLIRHYYKDADGDLFDNHSYAKGSRVLHMLRLFVGDEAFFKSVARYLTHNRFSAVEASDLKKAFEDVTGLDLSWFFQQWMYNPGHPVLEVEHQLQDDTLYLTVEQKQDFSLYPLYFLPLYVDLYWGDETLTYPMSIADQVHTFRIPAEGRSLKSIQFDPEFQLVGEITHARKPEEIRYLALQSEDFMARVTAYDLLLGSMPKRGKPDDRVIARILEEENEMVLVKYLDLLYHQNSIDWNEHRQQLLDLAAHGHPQVRALALLILDSVPALVDWRQVYSRDSSSYVVGLALETILSEGSKEANLMLVDSLKAEIDLNLLLPLTMYINEIYAEGYDSWYQEKIAGLRSSDQSYMLSAYNDYLLDASQIEKLSARAFLLHYAKYHIDSDTRLIAFEGLLLLADTVSVNRQVKEILAFEKDQQLLALYREFYPD